VRKSTIIALLFSLCCVYAYAQQRTIDSLKAVLKTEKDDSNKVKTLGELYNALDTKGDSKSEDSVSAIEAALAEKVGYKKGQASAYCDIGYNYYSKGNYPEGLNYEFKAAAIDKEIGNKHGLGVVYSNIGSIYSAQASYPQAITYLKFALSADSECGNERGQAGALTNLGSIYSDMGNYSEALKSQALSLELNKKIGDKQGIAAAYGNMGNIFYDECNYPEALKDYIEALKIEEGLGYKRGMSFAYGNIGNIYYHEGNYKDALDYHRKSLAIKLEIGNKRGAANAYGNIGITYEAMGQYDSALNNYAKGFAIYKEIGDKEGMSTSYTNIAVVNEARGNYAEAMQNEMLSLGLAKEIGDAYQVGFAFERVGGTLVFQKQYVQAKKYLDSAMAMVKTTGNKDVLRDIYERYAALDSATGNYKGAFEAYRNFIVYRDSLKNEENTKKLVSEQMQYEFGKKEAEEKAIQDKKNTENEANKRKQEIITASVSLGLLLVLVFSGLLFARFRVAQKQKRIIEEQKHVVEEKNREVLDSITYAKRLQDAILPPLSVVEKYLPESFILYKPKDIVAGDFYWMETVEGTIFIAACDCTGHGVPGAMVSVVCSNALNRAVKEFKQTEPGKILDKTRELVIETFEKSESDVMDGMDISLASLSSSERGTTLKWAGAYNSLWYAQNGTITEMAADKQPIGKSDNAKPFSTHTLAINADSISKGVLYLFTDGYADQFGGPKGKKFKYRQLQQLLADNCNLAMKDQAQLLEEKLTEWQGGLEQVDDILIIGIRV